MRSMYKQLSLEERTRIAVQLEMGLSPAAIAAGLSRSRSTVLRELRRNGWRPPGSARRRGGQPKVEGYHAAKAHKRAERLSRKPRLARKLTPHTALWPVILGHLRRRLSPAQIARTLARMSEPVRLSYETIYKALYAMPRGELRKQALLLLRRPRWQRRPTRARASRSFEAMTLIDQRPAEVDQRLVPGHWEGDLIKGKLNQSRVGVLVERTTLYVALVKLSDGSAPTTAAGFASILNRFDAHMRRSMTYDQGAEMACHRLLTERADVEVYFAHPHSPWERGICENTNGLLRQYLPKGKDLSVFSQEQLDDIAFELNARIRKSLGWKAPAELFLPEGAFDFQKYWANTINNVALEA
jgi:IS30 family transposase